MSVKTFIAKIKKIKTTVPKVKKAAATSKKAVGTAVKLWPKIQKTLTKMKEKKAAKAE